MLTSVRKVKPEQTDAIEQAAGLLLMGELVAFPTETVYGLGANGFDGEAVKKIFAAKGRPQDNPLILHIHDFSQLNEIWAEIPPLARKLADCFWPGPLTMIYFHTEKIPDSVTAGLDTVAVRMPSHPVALAMLKNCSVPVAAPSANLSGKPSPTTADHVLQDMDGRIPLILDGGEADFGVESTVITLTGEPTILRPGAVTKEMLEAVIGPVRVAESILSPMKAGEKAASPGMKYKHYAPSAKVRVISGEPAAAADLAIKLYDEAVAAGTKTIIFSTRDTDLLYGNRCRVLIGDRKEPVTLCRNLFRELRDRGEECDLILAEGIVPEAEGLAYMNRLLRAAGFDVIRADTMMY